MAPLQMEKKSVRPVAAPTWRAGLEEESFPLWQGLSDNSGLSELRLPIDGDLALVLRDQVGLKILGALLGGEDRYFELSRVVNAVHGNGCLQAPQNSSPRTLVAWRSVVGNSETDRNSATPGAVVESLSPDELSILPQDGL